MSALVWIVLIVFGMPVALIAVALIGAAAYGLASALSYLWKPYPGGHEKWERGL